MTQRVQIYVLALAIVIGGWLLFESYQREQLLRLQLVQQDQRIALLEQRLSLMGRTMDTLHRSSLDDMVKRANGALLDAWKDLINKLDEEVDQAREQLEREYDQQPDTAEPPVKRT